jgi:hypothetical protein
MLRMVPSQPDDTNIRINLVPPGDAQHLATLDMAHGKLVQDSAMITIDEAPMMKGAELDALVDTVVDKLDFHGIFIIAGNCAQLGPVLENVPLLEQPAFALPRARCWDRFQHIQMLSQMRVNHQEVLQAIRDIGYGRWPAADGSPAPDGAYRIRLPSRLFKPIPESKLHEAFAFIHPTMEGPDPHYDLDAKPAIATAANLAAADINAQFVQRLGDVRCYTAFNHVLEAEAHGSGDGAFTFTEEAAAALEHSGVPRNTLELAVGTPVHILGNLDFDAGLVKGELAVVCGLSDNHVAVRLLEPADPEHATWLLPRIIYDFQPAGFAVSIRRRQFPLAVAFASTTHRLQGSTAHRLLVDLRKPCFAHGQLYVNLSRVKEPDAMRFLVPDADISEDGEYWFTTNVVLKGMLTEF